MHIDASCIEKDAVFYANALSLSDILIQVEIVFKRKWIYNQDRQFGACIEGFISFEPINAVYTQDDRTILKRIDEEIPQNVIDDPVLFKEKMEEILKNVIEKD